jgi:hypothetical protein
MFRVYLAEGDYRWWRGRSGKTMLASYGTVGLMIGLYVILFRGNIASTDSNAASSTPISSSAKSVFSPLAAGPVRIATATCAIIVPS